MADTIFIEVSAEVPQKNGCLLYFTLYDYDETTPVPVDNIATATMTLINQDTGDEISALAVVKGSFNVNGIFSHYLTPDQNQIIDATDEKLRKQTHVALIKITATGETDPIAFEQEFWITIINQEHIANVIT